SETLLQRLRIDPNQSASEQLRALGFSESQIHTGSGLAPESRSSGQRPAPIPTPRRITGSGPGVRLDPEPRAAGRPPWLIPAAAAGVLLLVLGGGWFAFRGGEESAQQLDPAIEVIIRRDL